MLENKLQYARTPGKRISSRSKEYWQKTRESRCDESGCPEWQDHARPEPGRIDEADEEDAGGADDPLDHVLVVEVVAEGCEPVQGQQVERVEDEVRPAREHEADEHALEVRRGSDRVIDEEEEDARVLVNDGPVRRHLVLVADGSLEHLRQRLVDD